MTLPRRRSAGRPSYRGSSRRRSGSRRRWSRRGRLERRCSAETMPVVSVWSRPKGCRSRRWHRRRRPTRSRRARGLEVGSTFSSARSRDGSAPTTCGLRLVARADLDLDLRRALDDVIVGDDQAVLGDDEARPVAWPSGSVGDDVGDGVLGAVVDSAQGSISGERSPSRGAHRRGWVSMNSWRDVAPADGESRCDATSSAARSRSAPLTRTWRQRTVRSSVATPPSGTISSRIHSIAGIFFSSPVPGSPLASTVPETRLVHMSPLTLTVHLGDSSLCCASASNAREIVGPAGNHVDDDLYRHPDRHDARAHDTAPDLRPALRLKMSATRSAASLR